MAKEDHPSVTPDEVFAAMVMASGFASTPGSSSSHSHSHSHSHDHDKAMEMEMSTSSYEDEDDDDDEHDEMAHMQRLRIQASSRISSAASTPMMMDPSYYASVSSIGLGMEGATVLDKAASRLAAIERYRLKKANRSFKKKIRYESRRALASSRARVGGRFVKRSSDADEVSGAGKRISDVATNMV
eukprot:CAMPEP_0184706532 /NCGR_PEP_ID=MMETSP0313-20130426/36804_1 /TAXON_ID=2792 /ORGANISM="Porphyridium aerugineum, Strain SAG 1380-2" /LENGTH=185 /DNA_ID=CAMNT_0027168085 /DNA_START=787 /DNA_END=1344 /DNA_ORIENTATION=+